jgi:hypothetical protein
VGAHVDKTIVRDVCVVGGGATGTFAAIRLRDAGKSVVVVERRDRLGGHTLTYRDPLSGARTEAGVVVIRDSLISRNYFSRFGIQLTKFNPPPPAANVFVDLTTGRRLDFFPTNPTEAFKESAAQLAKYPFLDEGFELPDPLPEDLVLPFGEFVKKYDLGPMVFLTSKLCQGFGDLLAHPTLYVMKNFGATALQGLANGFLVPDGVDNSELYRRAEVELADSLLLGSTVVSSSRGKGGAIHVRVRTPAGQETLIKAKKLLVTIPPTLDNLAALDLDITEEALFRQFQHSSWWTLLIRNSGIPDGHYLTNLSPTRPRRLPKLPAIYEITPTGVPNTHNLKYGSLHLLSSDEVQRDVIDSLKRLHQTSPEVFQPGENPANLEVVLLTAHDPFGMTVPVSAIKDGFYDRLKGLNGYRNTFWTGAAFHAHDASLLWEYTQAVLDKYLL